MSARQKPNSQIVQEAAEWAEELDDGLLSLDQRQALAAWLLKSPEHVSELLMATTVFRAFDEADLGKDISIEDVLSRSAPDVIPMLHASSLETRGTEDTKEEDSRGFSRLWRRGSMIAAAATLVMAFSVSLFFTFSRLTPVEQPPTVFTTVTGEQRSVPLDDGSVVHLNTASEIRIRFENGERNVDLLRGEAMFQVAHDTNRPFRVYAGDTIAEALGTTFNVYRRDDQTTVAVIEGKVAVETLRDDMRETIEDASAGRNNEKHERPLFEERVTLTAGERAFVLTSGNVETDRVANMQTVTSWRLRKLVFERETLEAIVREYNRYGKLKIYVDDPTLAQTRFTGVFDADDPESLLTFLELAAGVRAVRRSPAEVRLQRFIQREG